ncbi:MAG: nucleotide sugar dehydrogenase [Bifidobacteriaceae bacterium]|nr:nucleotide sugar dehydrogenase [Bifidobacteriaceae bacterium]
MDISHLTIGVVGLGYVGLPLAVGFGQKTRVIGYDTSITRVHQLHDGHDQKLEVSDSELASATGLRVTSDVGELGPADIYIITTPTPVDEYKRPDLSYLISASRTVGRVLSAGNTVIYESTVYPGATEEVCVPVLEEFSGLKYNVGFFVGYSPERINPGDKQHRFSNTVKVTSGSTPECAALVDGLYRAVVSAGTYRASSIRVAEASKVIENIQRDVNIALVNELALLFNEMGIDTAEVLEAAGTKWNFLGFRPGLVGGHCIGIDPYYLTYKAQAVGFHPEIILAGRRINDSMGSYAASQLVKAMAKRGITATGSRVLVLGLAFKENTPDIRNTKVLDLVSELTDFGAQVDVLDPWVDPAEALSAYDLDLVDDPRSGTYDAIVLAVAHRQFADLGADGIHAFGKRQGHVFYDLRSVFPRSESELRL